MANDAHGVEQVCWISGRISVGCVRLLSEMGETLYKQSLHADRCAGLQMDVCAGQGHWEGRQGGGKGETITILSKNIIATCNNFNKEISTFQFIH